MVYWTLWDLDSLSLEKLDETKTRPRSRLTDGLITAVLGAWAASRLLYPSSTHLPASLKLFSLLISCFPATFSGLLGEPKYSEDGSLAEFGTKPSGVFEDWEPQYVSLLKCCEESFHCWNYSVVLRVHGNFCDNRPAISFTWEETFPTLEDCCKEKFRWAFDHCCPGCS
jgi:hypothetical protein